MSHYKHALVIGHTGVVGGNLASHLINLGDWAVTGVARNSLATSTGVTPITVDLLDRNATLQALSGLRPTHLYFTTWTRRDTEAENIKANGAMLANVLDAVTPARSLRHAALARSNPMVLQSPTRHLQKTDRVCLARTSTTPRRTSCSHKPQPTALAGACIAPTRSSATRLAMR